MLLWITITFLTLIAATSILIPLFNKRNFNISPALHDLNVYKSQLTEVEADLDRGTINPDEANAAKIEISHRILTASADIECPPKLLQSSSKTIILCCALVLVPIFSIGIYLYSGSPMLRDFPLEARLNLPTEQQDISLLIAQVEERLKESPDDGNGWEVVAPVYLRLQQPEKAIVAYNNVIRLLGPNDVRFSSLGEAIVLANEGRVVSDAMSAFKSALAINPSSTKSKFYLALGQSQSGEIVQAAASWKNLISEARGDEPWLETAEQQLAALELYRQTSPKNNGFAPDLSNFDLESFENLDSESRSEMITGMVDGLNERLKNEGGTLNEWLQLINSHIILGRESAAQDSVNQALKYFAGDQNSLDRIAAAAKEANLKIP